MGSFFSNSIKLIRQTSLLLENEYSDKKMFAKVLSKIEKPQRVIKKDISIKLDNGKKKTFTAYRCQHNNALGPFKGGIRFHPSVSEDEIKALSVLMTLKCSLAGILFGGSKGGISFDPKDLSLKELELLSKAYAKSFAKYFGPWIDVPAPDVNTDGQIMAWMLDSFEKAIGQKSPATFTGKPVGLGGSLGRNEATGRGGTFILKSFCKKEKLPVSKTTLAVQGFGNVGYWFSFFAQKEGFKVLAVSDSGGALFDKRGLNIEKLSLLKEKYGSFKKVSINEKIDFISNEKLLELDVDILVPAALENVISKDNADKIKAKVIFEMANGPASIEAEEILLRKKKDILPDILCNLGGVTVSYFEWAQNLQGVTWSEEKVNRKLKNYIARAFKNIYEVKKEKNISFRQAADYIALKRIIDAEILRGLC